MENLMELDLLNEKIDGKSIVLSRCDLTRALETFWGLFFEYFACSLGVVFVSVRCVPMFRFPSEKATQVAAVSQFRG